MKALPVQVELRHLGLGDPPPSRVLAPIRSAGHAQPFRGGGPGNEVHDHFIVAARLAPPVRRDEGKQPVLDLVPLTRAGREMVDGDRQGRVVGEPLELELPQAQAPAIAAAGVGRDQELRGVRIEMPALVVPPAANRRDRKRPVS